MDDVRFGFEGDALGLERGVHSLDVGDLEIDRGTPLSLLAGWQDAHEQPNSAAVEECHLRRRREQKRNSQHITVEGDAFLEVFHWNQKLSHFGVGQVHRVVLWIAWGELPACDFIWAI